MRKLFLSSSFNDVASLLEGFAKENIKGKSVTFIPTASINEKVKFYVGSARKAFEKMGVTVDELEITKATGEEISNKLKKNDYIYISGGNTFFLLQELRKSGADKIIIEEINSGKLYIGESAGAMVVSPTIEYVQYMDDCKAAPELKTFTALRIIDFYPIPHYTNFPFAKVVENIITRYESELQLYPISNSQVILVKGDDVDVIGK
ncbi:MAG: Type 1 glutamine amidotransferase-like domain-containing protein [Prevotella sp.]|jgi:dipeptidase E|nr:Type 1 glutamine amidotransferase-like domain-containing protein [Prevotella sp.]